MAQKRAEIDEVWLRAQYEGGKSASALAAETGISIHTILNRLRRMGVAIHSPVARPKAVTTELRTEMLTQIRTTQELAVTLAAAMEMQLTEAIVTARANKVSWRDIAGALGLADQTVRDRYIKLVSDENAAADPT